MPAPGKKGSPKKLLASQYKFSRNSDFSILLLILQYVFNRIHVFDPDSHIFLDILFSIYYFRHSFSNSKAAKLPIYIPVCDKLAVFPGIRKRVLPPASAALAFSKTPPTGPILPSLSIVPVRVMLSFKSGIVING